MHGMQNGETVIKYMVGIVDSYEKDPSCEYSEYANGGITRGTVPEHSLPSLEG